MLSSHETDQAYCTTPGACTELKHRHAALTLCSIVAMGWRESSLTCVDDRCRGNVAAAAARCYGAIADKWQRRRQSCLTPSSFTHRTTTACRGRRQTLLYTHTYVHHTGLHGLVNSLQNSAVTHITNIVVADQSTLPATDLGIRSRLWLASTSSLPVRRTRLSSCRPSATELFWLPLLIYGTLSRDM